MMKTTLTCKVSGHEDHAYKELFNILGMVGFYAGIEPENGELNLNKLLKRINELNERDEALAAEHFHCSKCGRYLLEDYAFCPDCGQRQDWSKE